MAHLDYALFESTLGFALFSVVHQTDAVGFKLKEVQQAAIDLSKFGKMVKLVNFTPFGGSAQALENVNLVSEGIVSEALKSILELSLPKTGGKKSKIVLGVAERTLAGSIKAAFPGLECETSDTSVVVAEILRGIRLHADKLLKGLQVGDLDKASLGLAHAYSRGKVKFSATRNDNHIIQAIAVLDTKDKVLNQGYMRLREGYGWHFPELIRIVSDNLTYAKLVAVIQNKKGLSDGMLHDIAAVIEEDGDKAQAIIDAAKVSMGMDMADVDLEIILKHADNVITQAQNRITFASYLERKLGEVAPNLQALVGPIIAARLISHAGSLANLAKCPASTLQILGAEKALFRALKSKSNTPKYGLLYNASAIGKAGPRNKGRISRYLANKCSMAARIDFFSEEPSSRFGEAFKQQVDDRLEFYATGKRPAKNVTVMETVMASLGDTAKASLGDIIDEDDEDEDMEDAPEPPSAKKQKKDKKDKKDKKKDKEEKKRKRTEEEAPAVKADDGEKKKKKKKSKAADNE